MIAGASPVKVGLVAIVVIAVLTFLGFTKDVPFVNEPFEIKAAFVDGSGLAPGSPVRIAGVEVGKVSRVEHTEPGARTVTATLAIRERGRPIREGARAAIRPRIFLEGNFFVDLQPGASDGQLLEDGDVIPAAQTSTPVQVGEILRILRNDTRAEVKGLLSGLADAQEAGAAREFSRSLDEQADAYRYSAVVAEALQGRQPGDIGRFIRAQGTVSAALDRNPPRLKALIENFNTFAAALADRDDELQAAIEDLAPALQEGLVALGDLNDAFPAVRRFSDAAIPAVASSRRTIPDLVPFLAELRGLVGPDELRGLSRDLRALTPDATRLARASVGLLEQTRTLSSCTSNVLVPHGNNTVPDPNFPASGKVFEEFPKIFPALAGESRTFDANGQWFRVLGTGGAETFDLGNNLFGTLAEPIVGTNPPADRTRPPLRPDAACETQQIPNLQTVQGPPPRKVDNDPDSPAARERLERVTAIASAIMQARLRAEGSDTKVRSEPITASELREVAARNGLSGQMGMLERQSKRLAANAAEARK